MKSLLLSALLALPLAATAADALPGNNGCSDLADGARSVAMKRDAGLSRKDAQAAVAKAMVGKSDFSRKIASNTIDYVFSNPDTPPQVLYWAVYGVCRNAVDASAAPSL